MECAPPNNTGRVQARFQSKSVRFAATPEIFILPCDAATATARRGSWVIDAIRERAALEGPTRTIQRVWRGHKIRSRHIAGRTIQLTLKISLLNHQYWDNWTNWGSTRRLDTSMEIIKLVRQIRKLWKLHYLKMVLPYKLPEVHLLTVSNFLRPSDIRGMPASGKGCWAGTHLLQPLK